MSVVDRRSAGILIDVVTPAMTDFKDQIDKTEADNVAKLIADLRAIAAKGQAGEAGVTADAIREQISKAQQASLGLFSKARSMPSQSHHVLLSADTHFTHRSTRRRTLKKPLSKHLHPHRLLRRRRHHRERVKRRTKCPSSAV